MSNKYIFSAGIVVGLLAALPQAVQAQLVLNEIYASPASGESEWLEIYNPGSQAVSLNGWQIAELTSGVIKNHELLVSEGEEATLAAQSWRVLIPTKVSLNNSGDTVYLFNSNGEEIDGVTYPKLTSSQSYARTPDGGDWQISVPTPGLANQLPEAITNTSNLTTTTNQDDKQTQSVAVTPIINYQLPTPTPNPTPAPTPVSTNSQAELNAWRKKIPLQIPNYILTDLTQASPAASLNLIEIEAATLSASVAGIFTPEAWPTPKSPSTSGRNGALALLIIGIAAIIGGLILSLDIKNLANEKFKLIKFWQHEQPPKKLEEF